MFLLQDDKGTWLVLLEVSLASASHGAGFSLPGQSVLGNVVVLGVYCVSPSGLDMWQQPGTAD